MKKFLNLFFLSFAFLFFILNISDLAYGIGNVDWVLLKENNDGKEWIDMGSIKTIQDNEISVLTRFYKKPNNSNNKGQLSLYVMRINCDEKKFKDTSVNGIPQFNSKWQTSNDDELIDVVIKKSCLNFLN